jgi:Alpha amylase, catalytic domain
VISKIGFGTAQVRPGTTRVELPVGQALTVGLGVTAGSPDELADAQAFVWTNYASGDPSAFVAVPMHPVTPSDGHQRAFEATLAPATVGTYVATAYVVTRDGQHWAQDYAPPDAGLEVHNLNNRLVFRVSSPEVEGLFVRQIPLDKANARSDSTDISTIDDMLEEGPGWYNLNRLAADGVNCLWVQVPYRIDLWDGLPAVDDAGSDFASTDWFSIDPELSREARVVPPWDRDRQRELANGVMKRFVDRAHELGMKVIFDIAPNHVGHNFIFRDSFEGPGGFEIRRRDYRQVAVNEAQLAEVNARLGSPSVDETVKDYAESVLPQMYAARYPDGTYNPFGAANVFETYSPDWYGVWADTKHLNHGGHAGQRIWYPKTEQNYRVLAYIGRVMRFAAIELGVDGFRFDHALGMPYHFFEQTLPWVEMNVRERRGDDSHLLLVHEDHDRKDYSARVGDIVQSKGYEGLLHALTHQDVEGVWNLYNNPNFTTEFAGTGNHDEVRGSTFFPGDLLAYGNAVLTMQFMGGPMTMLAGDEYAEAEKLRFKAKGGIPTLWQLRLGQLPQANQTLAFWVARGGRLKNSHPALRGTHRERLGTVTVGGVPRVLACARSSGQPGDVPLMMFNNLDRQEWVTGAFDVGAAVRAWLGQAPAAFYQIRDLIGLDPQRPLWRRPLPGQELLDQGIGVGLQPFQIQLLELERLA